MKRSRITTGRRFSIREIHQTTTADGIDLYHQPINWEEVWCRKTIDRHLCRSREILESESIDVASLLADSPSGSSVRDYVLNHLDHEPTSRTALAAKILETCLHINAYEALDGGQKLIPGLAYSLGILTALERIYVVDSEDHRNRRRDKPSSDPYDNARNERIRAFYKNLESEMGKGARGVLTQTSEEFGLSTKQIGRIIKAKRT